LGNLIKEELWGMRSLAYPIKHADRAFFAHFEFEAEPAVIITLDKNIRLTEDIIRYLIVRIEEKRKKVKPAKKEEKVEVIEKEEIKEEDKTKGKAKKK
jgi:small subunit ribosomal protein S6